MGWHWHQLDYTQIIITFLQMDYHSWTSSLNLQAKLLAIIWINDEMVTSDMEQYCVLLFYYIISIFAWPYYWNNS